MSEIYPPSIEYGVKISIEEFIKQYYVPLVRDYNEQKKIIADLDKRLKAIEKTSETKSDSPNKQESSYTWLYRINSKYETVDIIENLIYLEDYSNCTEDGHKLRICKYYSNEFKNEYSIYNKLYETLLKYPIEKIFDIPGDLEGIKQALWQQISIQLETMDLIIVLEDYEGITGKDYYSLVQYKVLLHCLQFFYTIANSFSKDAAFKMYFIARSQYEFSEIKYLDKDASTEIDLSVGTIEKKF